MISLRSALIANASLIIFANFNNSVIRIIVGDSIKCNEVQYPIKCVNNYYCNNNDNATIILIIGFETVLVCVRMNF